MYVAALGKLQISFSYLLSIFLDCAKIVESQSHPRYERYQILPESQLMSPFNIWKIGLKKTNFFSE